MKRLILIPLLSLLAVGRTFAVGEWQFYANYSNYSDVALFGDDIYVVASGHLYVTATLSRLNGLTGSTVQTIVAMEYDVTDSTTAATDGGDALAIVYTDGGIDLIDRDGTLRTVSALRTLATSADKSINGATAHGHSLWLATGFGIVEVDVERGVVTRSYQTDESVLAAWTWNGYTYYSTASATLRAADDANFYSPASWNEWTTYGVRSVAYAGDECWLLTADHRLIAIDAAGTSEVVCSGVAGMAQGDGSILLTGGTFGMVDATTHGVRLSDITSCADAVQTSDSIVYIANPTEGLLTVHVSPAGDDLTLRADVTHTSRLDAQTGSDLMGDIAYADGRLIAVNSSGLRAAYGVVYT